MSSIYGAKAIKAWDAYTIANTEVTSLELMERAAISCCKRIIGTYVFQSVAIVCGQGNNGGDGLAIARILAARGKNITVYVCNYAPQFTADFQANLKRLPSTVNLVELSSANDFHPEADLLVDCLFGSGLNRPIGGWLSEIVRAMNACKIPIVAIDIPSGLFIENNTKNDLTSIIKAETTLSFQRPKLAFFHAAYKQYVGRFIILDIGLSNDFDGAASATYIDRSEVSLRPVSDFAHKGSKGYLTVIAGSENMIGAAILCSTAAFKTGCGYVGLVSHENAIIPLANKLPEAIWLGKHPETFPSKSTAIAIGPGLGTNDLSLKLLHQAFEAKLPLIIDADAINLISMDRSLLDLIPKDSILTPHLGELKRLLGPEENPELLLKKQQEFSQKYGVHVIQKGAYSKLTCKEGKLYINSTGNSGMATAGMGDALTGIIGSFLAQGYAPLTAAINGMYYHGLAGDYAVSRQGKIGLLTSDLITALPTAFNKL